MKYKSIFNNLDLLKRKEVMRESEGRSTEQRKGQNMGADEREERGDRKGRSKRSNDKKQEEKAKRA
jgi:hypothetical protein